MSSKMQPADRRKTKKQTVKSKFFYYFRLIVVVLTVTLFIENFILINARIPSDSMEPTVMTGDRLFGSRLTYIIKDPQRFDIVMFRYPDDENVLFIKRVIGLPGDTIDIRNGDVYVNGSETPLPDDFCSVQDATETGNLTFPLTVPEDSYFMLGDNRPYSKDSRYWDNPFVKRDKIIGKAVLRYWPITQIHIFTNEEASISSLIPTDKPVGLYNNPE